MTNPGVTPSSKSLYVLSKVSKEAVFVVTKHTDKHKIVLLYPGWRSFVWVMAGGFNEKERITKGKDQLATEFLVEKRFM